MEYANYKLNKGYYLKYPMCHPGAIKPSIKTFLLNTSSSVIAQSSTTFSPASSC